MKTAPRFFPALEALRGGAALAVALFHTGWRSHLGESGFIENAWLMVDYFFVLSGFVMMHAYGAKLRAGFGVRRFLLLRLGRLYPLHLATLAFFLAVECLRWAAGRWGVLQLDAPAFSENSPKALAANLLLVHAVGPMWPTFNPPSWSISTEFWAYVLFAAVAIALRTGRRFLAGAVALMLGGGYVAWLSHWPYPRCLYGFFAGVIAWLVWDAVHERWHAGAATVALAGAAAVSVVTWAPEGAGEVACVPFFALFILAIALADIRTVHPSLQWLGKVSYSLYMVHTAVLYCLDMVLIHGIRVQKESIGVWAGDALVVGYVGLALLLSNWTFRHVEDRFRRLARAQWG